MKLRKLSLFIVAAMAAVVVIGCTPKTTTTVSTAAPTTTTVFVADGYVEFFIALDADAQDLICSSALDAALETNSLYLVGSFVQTGFVTRPAGSTSVNSLAWEPTVPSCELAFLSNISIDSVSYPLYYGKVEYDIQDASLEGVDLAYKVVNGTPGYGGSWDSQARYYLTAPSTTNVSTTTVADDTTNFADYVFLSTADDRANTTVSIATGENYTQWWTNVIGTADEFIAAPSLNYMVQVWRGIPWTFRYDYTLNLVCIDVANAADPAVAAGDSVALWGGYNSWAGGTVTATVASDGSATLTIANCASTSFEYQLRFAGFNGSWDVSGHNASYTCADADPAIGAVYTVTNDAGTWRAW